MSKYSGSENHGNIRGRYGLKGDSAILEKNLFLGLILAVNNNHRTVKDVIQYLLSKTGEKKFESNLNKPLNDLVRAGIFIEEDCDKVARGRKKIIYKINYFALSELFLDKVLFKELQQYGLNKSFKTSANQEASLILPFLLKRYADNFNKYLNDKEQNSQIKAYLGQMDNFATEHNIHNRDKTVKTTLHYKVLSLNSPYFRLKEFAEGFFKYLTADRNIMHISLKAYYKSKNMTYNYIQTRNVDSLLTMIDVYFSVNRYEVLSKINQYYNKESKTIDFNSESL